MKFTINKAVYNVFETLPKAEKISTEIVAKFGAAKNDVSKRALFIELNIECKDGESEVETRNLLVVARLNYTLDKTKFKDLDDKEIAEDNKYYIKLLERLNETVKNITSQDDVGRPLNLDKAVESQITEN